MCWVFRVPFCLYLQKMQPFEFKLEYYASVGACAYTVLSLRSTGDRACSPLDTLLLVLHI